MIKNRVKEEKAIRELNYEALRILSMLLIIMYHANIHLSNNADGIIYHRSFSFHQIFLNIVGIWGQVGVICFVFISTHFLKKVEKVKLVNVISICLQVAFYGVAIVLICDFAGVESISIKNIIKEVFGVFLNEYWFITAYCMLYILAPVFNAILKSMNYKSLRCAVILLTLFMPIYKTILSKAPFSEFGWMCYLYMLLYYLELSDISWIKKYCVQGLVISCILCVVGVTMLMYGCGKIEGTGKKVNELMHIGSVFPLIVSIFLFYTFGKIRIHVYAGGVHPIFFKGNISDIYNT